MTSYREGDLGRALKAASKLARHLPERHDVQAFAGMVALSAGRHRDSIAFYQRAVRLNPSFADAYYNLGNALRSDGQIEEAVDAFRRATEARPDFAQAFNNLGSVLQTLDRFSEAEAAFAKACALDRSIAESQRNHGMVLEQLGRLEEAVAAFRRAVELRPDWSTAYTNLAWALQKLGESAAVVEICDAWNRLDPGNVEALSVKALALNDLGRRMDFNQLYDFDRLVHTTRCAAPEGFADIEAFNAALVEHVLAHPSLKVPDEDHPTYHHPKLQITGNLLEGEAGPLTRLQAMMETEVRRYVALLGGAEDHPFLATSPERWHLVSWAAVLNGEGNLLPHIHLDGYLSGVYYAQVPEVVGADGFGEPGWLELGRPPDHIVTRADPVVRRIRPEPGLMVLFPAFMYHGTVPYRADDWRISIAFDVVPDQ